MELDFLGQEQQENKSQNKQYQNAQDFLDLSQPQEEKKPADIDDYLNFLNKTNASKITAPPKRTDKALPQDKYDVFS